MLRIACIIASSCAIGVMAAPANQEVHTFSHFLGEFKKSYPAKEMTMRKRLFEASVEQVKSHNANPAFNYTIGINQFSDMTNEEKAMYLGRKGHRSGYDAPLYDPPSDFMLKLKAIKDLPKSIDWRDKGVTTPVKNQGGCGSCWAFSATEVLESHVAIQTGKLLTLSPQQLVSCSPNPDKCGGTGGCDGSTQWLAFNYTEAAGGLSLESEYPYTERTGKCKDNEVKPAAGNKGYVRLPANNYTVLMNAIQLGPVAISLAAGGIMSYIRGIYDGNCGYDIDHAVVLEGYGPGYYLVRNSWGAGWGEDGYIRIARTDEDSTRCGDDKNPKDGTACAPYPKTMKVCGLCGILSDSSYPTGTFVV